MLSGKANRRNLVRSSANSADCCTSRKVAWLIVAGAVLAVENALRFLSDDMLAGLFVFPRDQQPPEVEINRLGDQLLVHYYEQDLRGPGGGGRRG